MISLFMQLEPRFAEKGVVIYSELEEINDMLFIEKGVVDVGFEITKKSYMVLRIEKGSIIGAFNCMTEKRNQFIYKCRSSIEGYMLRKTAWFEIKEDFAEIADILLDNVKTNFLKRIKNKVEEQKQRFIDMIKEKSGEK